MAYPTLAGMRGRLMRTLPSLVGAAAFTPTDISGLSLWLDADASYLLTEPSARQFTLANTEYLSRASEASLSFGDTNWFGCLWVKRDTIPPAAILISKNDYTTNTKKEWELVVVGGGGCEFVVSSDGTTWYSALASSTTMLSSTGVWYFVMFYHDADNNVIGVSVDGEPFATVAHSGGVFAGPEDLRIAARFNGGSVDVSRWDGPISAAVLGKSPTDSWDAIRDYFYNNGIPRKAGEITAAKQTSTGLVEFWPLNEYDGNALGYFNGLDLTDNNTVTSAVGPGTDKIADESSNANHGTITGFTNPGDIVSTDVPSALAGSLDYSMETDGTGYVDCGDNDLFSFGDGSSTDSPFSLSAWFYWDGDTTSFDGIISKRVTNLGDEWQFTRTSNEAKFGLALFDSASNIIRQTSTGTLSAGWNYVAASYDGSSTTGGIKLYLNGSLDSSTPLSVGNYAAMHNTSAPLRLLFVLNQVASATCKVSDARIYDYALTADNVTYLHTAGASGTAPATGPVGHWGGSNDSFPVGAVVDGQPVIRATDRSANGVDAAQTTLAKRPIYDSANSALTYDSVDDIMDLISSLALTDCTIFVKTVLASDVTSATAQKTLLGTQSAGAASDGAALITLGATSAGLTNETASMLAQDNATTRGVGYATTISSGTRVLTYQLSGTTETIYLDGTSVSVSQDSGGSLDSATAGQRFDRLDRIGGDSTPANYLDDKIVEVLVYDSALSADDIDSVHTYLGL